jgi:hypothetical protein
LIAVTRDGLAVAETQLAAKYGRFAIRRRDCGILSKPGKDARNDRANARAVTVW